VEPAVRSLDQPPPRQLDNVIVRRQLSIAPRAIAVSPPPAESLPVIKTTKTTTVVDTPGMPRRIYNRETSTVMVEDQNQTRELTYVTVPVLFVKDTAELFDTRSATALQQMAGVILEICAAEPQAVFDIEGHTSTEGTAEHNMTLSGQRAQRVYDELTQRYAVPATVLSAHGYGKNYPAHPNGTEEELQLDRRVLLVRTR
jgi:outer membrane protein OmpA-like peptidoglycan-associated protein